MPETLHDGLRRQLQRLAELEASGETLGGWKVGLTSGRARDAMGAGFRPFGYLLASRILPSPATLALAGRPGMAVENELCFTLGRNLAGNPDRHAVIDAIAAVSPAFEIAEQRLERGAPPADVLADDLSQWGIVHGAPKVLDWDGFDFPGLVVALRRDGDLVEEIAAQGHIDDHFTSIGALTRQLHAFGLGLRAGDRVITGSFTRQAAAGPCRWVGDFGPVIGTVELALS